MTALGPGERLFTVGVRPAGCPTDTGYYWDEYDLAATDASDAVKRARAMADDPTSEIVAWYGLHCEIADSAEETPGAVYY